MGVFKETAKSVGKAALKNIFSEFYGLGSGNSSGGKKTDAGGEELNEKDNNPLIASLNKVTNATNRQNQLISSSIDIKGNQSRILTSIEKEIKKGGISGLGGSSSSIMDILSSAADIALSVGGSALGGIGRAISGPLALPLAIAGVITGLAVRRARAEAEDPEGAEAFRKRINMQKGTTDVIQGPEAEQKEFGPLKQERKLTPTELLKKFGLTQKDVVGIKGNIITIKDGRKIDTTTQDFVKDPSKPNDEKIPATDAIQVASEPLTPQAEKTKAAGEPENTDKTITENIEGSTVTFDSLNTTFNTEKMEINAQEMTITPDLAKQIQDIANGSITSGTTGAAGVTPGGGPSVATPPAPGGAPSTPAAPTTPGGAPSTPAAPTTPGGATGGEFGAADKTGANGRLPDSALASIGIGSHKAQPAAAAAFIAMRQAAKNDKVDLGVSGAYRTYQRQVELKREKGRMAATPGRSNHGWGLAFDMSFGGNMSSPGFKWMQQNASKFGIRGPLQNPFEAWHWEYKGGGGQTPKYEKGSDGVPVTGPAIVGEKGSELIISKNGGARLTGQGPKVETLQQGDAVVPNDKTKKLLRYAEGTGNADSATWSKLSKAEKMALLTIDRKQGGDGKDISALLGKTNSLDYKTELSRANRRVENEQSFGNFGSVDKKLIEQSEGRINDYGAAFKPNVTAEERSAILQQHREQQGDAYGKLSDAISKASPPGEWNSDQARASMNSFMRPPPPPVEETAPQPVPQSSGQRFNNYFGGSGVSKNQSPNKYQEEKATSSDFLLSLLADAH